MFSKFKLSIVLFLSAASSVFASDLSWGGVPFNAGPLWYGEYFPDGESVYRCWEIDPQTGQDKEVVKIFDWKTSRWSIDGQVLPVNASIPSGHFGYATNTTGNSHLVAALSQGTVKVRMKYLGKFFIPTHVDLLLNPVASCAYTANGSGSAENGVGGENFTTQEPGGTNIDHRGKRIRTFKLEGLEVNFSYSPSANSFAQGINSNCGASALWANAIPTNRRVDLRSINFPITTGQVPFGTGSISLIDWGGQRIFQYPILIPAPLVPTYTERGTEYKGKVGIPQSEYSNLGTTSPPPGTIFADSNFQGLVTGITAGVAKYEGSFEQSQIINGGPSGNEWQVNPFWTQVNAAYNEHWPRAIPKPFTNLIPGDANQLRTTKFSYRWDEDGAQGDAKITHEFKFQCDRNQEFGKHTEIGEPQNPTLFFAGTDSPFARRGTWQDLITLSDDFVSYENDSSTMFWEQVNGTYSVADFLRKHSKVLKPMKPFLDVAKQKVAATWIGFIPDLLEVVTLYTEPEKVEVSRHFPYFVKASYVGDINPPLDPSVNLAALDPAQQLDLMSSFDWREKRRQLYEISFYADDIYDATGFKGQQMGDKASPTTSFDRRQIFRKESPTEGDY